MITTPTSEQQATPGSREARTLQHVYSRYEGRNQQFEGLAEVVAERVLGKGGSQYRTGWLTPSSSDGGADFIGRLDVGTDFSRTKLIVLGQAKCEKLDRPTGGNHIGRTVARLRRGWIGVYVTTSYFSEAVQREVYEDDYPIVLINGRRVAEELEALSYESGKSVAAILDKIDAEYEHRIEHRDPREILHD